MARDTLVNSFRKLPLWLRQFILREYHSRFDVATYLGAESRNACSHVKLSAIVIGMHRSGTSLLGEVLSSAGIAMGADLIQPTANNARGYFENRLFVKLNDKILAMAGGSWEHPPSHNRVLGLCADSALRQEIELAIKSQERQLWGWKDPRTSLTMDLFLPFLRNPRFIFAYRDKVSVAKSLKKRNQIPFDEGIRLAEIYDERIKAFYARCSFPKLEVRYEQMLGDPITEMGNLLKFLGIDRQPEPRLVDQGLRHF